ncbi:hypothetical protein GCM10007919_51650 [Rhizobium indigoferae]|nr:hypothetical protein GCM10007919_51650 [Rhizobium indigoferae]
MDLDIGGVARLWRRPPPALTVCARCCAVPHRTARRRCPKSPTPRNSLLTHQKNGADVFREDFQLLQLAVWTSILIAKENK